MEYHPENTLTNYVTRLPKLFDLKGEWEVGLVEIQYPHSWYNIPESAHRSITASYRETDNTELITCEFTLQPGYYSITSLLDTMVNRLKNTIPDKNSMLYWRFDEVSQYLELRLRIYTLNVGPFLQDLLKLPDLIITPGWYKTRPINTMKVINSLYVYCDLVESRVVGDTMAPLLRIIPVSNQIGGTVIKTYENIHYLPLQRKTFQTVEIDIRDHTGKNVPFEYGTLNVTLHLRRKRSIL